MSEQEGSSPGVVITLSRRNSLDTVLYDLGQLYEAYFKPTADPYEYQKEVAEKLNRLMLTWDNYLG